MRTSLTFGAWALCCAAAAQAAPDPAQPEDLADLTIEELANIEVRSASKRDEPLSSAPTSLFVITGDDIEASGVVSLPEALRLAPNLIVQQVDASDYSISARGFTGTESANKLLVLIDGRTVYTPLASQVLWQLHSPLLEDIRQIEVISGPGGTLYGPNAVNGVVSITSRDARETIGTLLRGTAGAYEQTAAARHGFAVGSGAVRLYGNWHQQGDLPTVLANDVDDGYRGWQAGFRSDFGDDANAFTLQGDIFRNRSDILSGDGNKGHNILGRWSRTLDPASSLQLQAYYDRFERDFIFVHDSLQTVDAEAQFNSRQGAHELVVGAGVRTTRDEFTNALNFFQLNPTRRRLWVYNAFVQDQISLAPELDLIAGVKVERSTFTGWQVLPNLRLAWQPNARTLFWGAVSRAVRTPSRIDRQLEAPPFLAAATDFLSEKLVAFEVGYRGQPSSNTSLSVSAFVNEYDDLRTTELTDGALPFFLANGIEGRSYGIEAWGHAQVTPWWRLSLGGLAMGKDFEVKEGHVDIANMASLGFDPDYQLVATSDFTVSPNFRVTFNGRAVGGLNSEAEVGSYVEAGGRLAYQLSDRLELYVAGRNLLHRDHAENNDPDQRQLPKRSVYAGTRVRF